MVDIRWLSTSEDCYTPAETQEELQVRRYSRMALGTTFLPVFVAVLIPSV